MKTDTSTPNVQTVTIVFDENTSHTSVLAQAVNGLAKKKFASEKEIKAEWKMLLSLK